MFRYSTRWKTLAHFEPLYSSKEKKENHHRLTWFLIESFTAFLGSTAALAFVAAHAANQSTLISHGPSSSASLKSSKSNSSPKPGKRMSTTLSLGRISEAFPRQPSAKMMAKRRDSGLDLSELCSVFHRLDPVEAKDKIVQEPQVQEAPAAELEFAESLVESDRDHCFARAMYLYHCKDMANTPCHDEQAIIDLFEFAAAHGHQQAAFNLAVLYEEKGMKHRALTLYKQAAHEGMGRAAFRVAFILLERVFGEDQSGIFQEALEWLQMASSNGFLLASETLNMISMDHPQ